MRKHKRICMICLGAAVALAGCVTTEQAGQVIQSRWIGQGADEFFQAYGAPRSEFALSNGSVMFTWRGGETTKHIAATYAAPTAPALPGFGTTSFGGNTSAQPPAPPAPPPLYSSESVRTQTEVENPAPGVTRTTTTTTSTSASVGLGNFGLPSAPAAAGGRQMLSPARTEQLFCELQLTVDAGNMITAIRITRDTAAAGIGLSRCAEVLDVRS
jgi:predicted small secreted protein